MSYNSRNAKHVKGQKGPMMKTRSGADARYAGEQEERKVSDMAMRAHLVIAPSYRTGRTFVDRMGWRQERAAIITDPDYLRGLSINPGEDIWLVGKDLDPEFFKHLLTCTLHHRAGESANLKLVTV